ncbi:MAG: threonylcarbamoyl-AMP synthase [Bacteroidales bacterium]|nr:threonylcarbamoyl-AMP synthase [Bacteroidales bacterium]
MDKKKLEQEINNTLKVLNKNGIILYPTDTIWGIGCDATNYKAVEKINKIKKRTKDKNFIVLIDDIKKLRNYVENIPEILYDLIESIDTPLTIIYPYAKNLTKNVIAKDNSIGIRITKDVFCKKLIQLFGKPIVSTSANISGEENPIYFNKISKDIINSVDYVVDLFHDRIKEIKPSTIIKLKVNGEFSVIRR